MPKRHQLVNYISSLKELTEIMSAMKNLSLIEMNKVTKFLSTQEKVVNNFEEAGIDFLNFFPDLFPASQKEQQKIYILLGSERGFCGNFNDSLISRWQMAIQNRPDAEEAKLVLVGRKLAMKFSDDPKVIKTLDGPNTAEEIPDVILSLIESLEELPSKEIKKQNPVNWNIIYNEMKENKVQTTLMLPFLKLKEIQVKKPFSFPPLLNLSPKHFFQHFLDQYLFTVFYNLFYQSLMAENNQRLHHMNGAISRLEKQTTQLTQQLNLLRQEEITEEIEIIILSAETLLEDLRSNF